MQNILDTLKLSTAAKAWVGFAGVVLQAILANVPLDHASPWFSAGQAVLALATAFGIFQVSNAPAPGSVPASDAPPAPQG